MLRRLLAAIVLLTAASAAPVKILTIGDSLTDEYGAIADLANDLSIFGTIDSIYPEPDEPSNNPRAFNWPELLELKRPTQADFGVFGSWTSFFLGVPVGGDLRYKGYKYNFAVASTTSTDWVEILTGSTSTTGFPLASFFFPRTRSALFSALPEVDVVVIFLGGNDLKNDYDQIFNNTESPAFFDNLLGRLDTIHGIVRGRRPSVPIIVATVPDVGATPNVYGTYNLPAAQVSTRAKIAAFNDDLIAHFSAKPNTGIARVDRLTSEILDIVLGVESGPFDLNGTEFVIGGNPYNPPQYLFCKDSFHPNTVGQALIANEVIAAVNGFFPGAAAPFTHREILQQLLQLDPDQPYLDWIAPHALAADGPDDDPDGDGLPNLVEMILGTSPAAFSSPITGSWPAGISWTPLDSRYATLTAEESTNLETWTPVPAGRLSSPAAQVTATPPPGAPSAFLRLRANPRP